MSEATNKVSHTADRIEHVAKESAKEKQSGNTRALLFQNLPIIREVRSAIGGTLGLLETTGDALYRTLSLASRPQDLKHTGKIIRNGIKATIAEAPQVETKGIKEYRQNLRAPKLTRDTTKQYHDPYLDDTKFFDTHGTDLSLAPKKSDKRYTKLAKFIPFTAGKVAKIPLHAANILIGATTDTFRWMKGQKLRDMVTFNFTKTNRNKTSHAWKKLTSRAYNGNTTNTNIQSTNQEQSDTKQEQDTKNTSEKKSFWSRLWPFNKKKKEPQETKKEEPKDKTESEVKKEGKEKIKDTDKKPESKKEQEVPKKETIAPEVLATIVTGHAAIEGLKQAFENKDKAALDVAKDKILRAQATEKTINKDNLSDEHKALFKEIKSTATDIGQLKYKLEEAKVIDIKESNEAMGDYINQEQRKFTKLYNNKEKIKDEDITKRIKSLQKYQKSGGKIVFTGKQKQDGEALSGKLDSLVIEDDKVKVGFTSDDNQTHTDEIELNKVFDSKFSVHAPEAKAIDITNRQAA